ncbi:hypothetical protein SDRG_16715 [Saprolegnia diclina VS20]|uniref:Uncharacterized protein n=1 Tax=Saprolegnia diclina (strain VS20) TaxID=1156394 RepID=T0PWL7_SAPDV|nr:hypothetical protein SDRG_16715 [Saprolegnia diclina VS20]EQC25415.1 hypothetical protein SDRG_16715 [Saprolegnia diclina VS20]|eukprot:XP_008621155.1 hypothetical protein SDRG_16715 [Saprolegnia diclina VS20]
MFSTLVRTVRRRSRFFSIDSARPSVGPACLEPKADATNSAKPDPIAACHRDSNSVDVTHSLAMKTAEIPFDRSISNENANMENKTSRTSTPVWTPLTPLMTPLTPLMTPLTPVWTPLTLLMTPLTPVWTPLTPLMIPSMQLSSPSVRVLSHLTKASQSL